MDWKKWIIIIIMIVVWIILWYLSSIIDNFIWYIILFPVILWWIWWFIYNFLLKENSITSKNKGFIYTGITIFVITLLFSTNAFNYHESKKTYINVVEFTLIQDDSKIYIQELLDIEYTDYESLKKIDSTATEKWEWLNEINKSLAQIKTAIWKEDYNLAIDEFKLYFKVIWILFDVDEDLWIYIEESLANLEIVKENLNITDINKIFDDDLKVETWFDWYLGFQIITFKAWETISSGWSDIDTNIYWSIAIYIIDLIAIIYWVIFSLSILKTLVCELHNKGYKKYWKDLTFSTILTNINLEKDEIINQLNTEYKKVGILWSKWINYINISYYKCPKCEIDLKETKIEMKFSFYWKSKNKPLTWLITKSFIISKEEYDVLINKLEILKKEEVKEIIK